jgi:MFS-type transporter involved in bile tolerance (Atg22 family)
MWPNFFGRKYLGSIQGVATIFGVVGSALGPVPFGLIFDITNSYVVVLYSVTALAIIGALTSFYTNAPVKR